MHEAFELLIKRSTLSYKRFEDVANSSAKTNDHRLFILLGMLHGQGELLQQAERKDGSTKMISGKVKQDDSDRAGNGGGSREGRGGKRGRGGT